MHTTIFSAAAARAQSKDPLRYRPQGVDNSLRDTRLACQPLRGVPAAGALREVLAAGALRGVLAAGALRGVFAAGALREVPAAGAGQTDDQPAPR